MVLREEIARVFLRIRFPYRAAVHHDRLPGQQEDHADQDVAYREVAYRKDQVDLSLCSLSIRAGHLRDRPAFFFAADCVRMMNLWCGLLVEDANQQPLEVSPPTHRVGYR